MLEEDKMLELVFGIVFGIVFIGYFILGLFKMSAFLAGVEVWLGLHWLIALPFALFVAYTPIMGSAVGMFGAVAAWHWSWVQAFCLFYGSFFVIILISMNAIFIVDSRKKGSALKLI